MKNSVPKNDKKRKKQLTVEIAQLEAELDERHHREEEELQAGSGDAGEEVCKSNNGWALSQCSVMHSGTRLHISF